VPPAAFTKEMKADAIEEKPPRGEGEKSWWVAETLRRVPLAYWEKRFQMNPVTILAALAKDDYATSFLYAATEAVQTFPGHDHWLEPLWDALYNLKSKNILGKVDLLHSFSKICVERIPEKFIVKFEDRKGKEIHAGEFDTAWFEWTLKTPIPWNDSFADLLFKHLQKSDSVIQFVNAFAPFFPKRFLPPLRALLAKMKQEKPYFAKNIAEGLDLLASCEEFETLLQQCRTGGGG